MTCVRPKERKLTVLWFLWRKFQIPAGPTMFFAPTAHDAMYLEGANTIVKNVRLGEMLNGSAWPQQRSKGIQLGLAATRSIIGSLLGPPVIIANHFHGIFAYVKKISFFPSDHNHSPRYVSPLTRVHPVLSPLLPCLLLLLFGSTI